MIGRETGCQLRLLDPGVRDRHAAIERRADGYYIRDLDETDARPSLRVNGQLVREQRLSSGDELEIGAVQLQFEVLHQTARGRRRFDPLFGAATLIVAGSILGQIALLAWVFAQPRPRDPNVIAGDRSAYVQPELAPVPGSTFPVPASAATPVPVAPASAPPAAPAAGPAVLDRMVRITRIQRTDAAAHVTLTLIVKAQVSERALDPTQTAVSVQLFGFDGTGRMAPALDPFWLTIPAWENFTSKSFAVRFPLPPAQFAGYVVRTYYRGRLQDVAAMPVELLPLAPNEQPPGAP